MRMDDANTGLKTGAPHMNEFVEAASIELNQDRAIGDGHAA
jgi:hypothetical protein